MKYRRPRYMNDGGIASLLSNGGSEAMMLELEGDAAALPGDLFSDEPDPRWLSHPEDEGYLPEARIRRQLQRKAGSQIGEWLENLTGMFDMQGTYEEELQRQGFSSLSPEQQELIAEILMPGAGIVKTTKMGLKTLDQLKKTLADKAKSMKSSSKINVEREIDPKTGFRHDVPKDATTHLKQSISKTKKLPPEMRYGGALSYKKGYYGKSYR